MILECGPEHDKRYLNFTLPNYKNFILPGLKKIYNAQYKFNYNNKIGVLVSGGLDSALMYYMVLKENTIENKFDIKPYTILRKEGSKHFAIKVINHIHKLLNIAETDLNVVGDNTLPEIRQVESGVNDLLVHNDFVYVGIIESRPEHSENWYRHKFEETERLRYPLLKFQKSHVIDLIYKLNLESVIQYTHSCASDELIPCLKCNGCLEREWGFREIFKS